jgi:serine/threonine protein kinase
MLGKYRLVQRLGAGGMGVVFLAEDTVLRRMVAIKLLAGSNNTPHLVQRFLREARAAAQISHPHVVSIFDVNTVGEVAYLVMELLSGGSVQEHLSHLGPLPWEQAVRFTIEAARGLAAAHRAGLIHRDVKPSNLLLSEEGTVKVADFGLVKMFDSGAGALSSSSHLLGTPHFMSPEQCKGEAIDERSDIYGLGATLYVLLTGKMLYHAENTYGLLFAHCSTPPPDPRTHTPNLPEQLPTILRRALAKTRAERYPNMTAFADDLERCCSTTTHPPIKKPSLPPNWTRRTILGIGLLGIGTGAGWFLTRSGRSHTEAASTTTPTVARSWDEILAALRSANPSWKGKAITKIDKEDIIGLELTGNHLLDLGPIAALTRLRSFHYRGESWEKQGQLHDLLTLASLPLDKLVLELVSVRSLESVGNLPLVDLELRGTKIEDLSPVQQMPIRRLVVDGGVVKHREALAHLRQLVELKLVTDRVRNLAPVEGLPTLARVQLFATSVSDLTPLRRSPIVWLDIRKSKAIKSLISLIDTPLRELLIDESMLSEPGVRSALSRFRALHKVNGKELPR